MILKALSKVESVGELANYPGKFRVRFILSDDSMIQSCILSEKQRNRLELDVKTGKTVWIALDSNTGPKADQFPYRWVWCGTDPDWLKSSFIDNPRASNWQPRQAAAPSPAPAVTRPMPTTPPVAMFSDDDIPF